MNVSPGSSVPTVSNHPEVPSAAFALGSQVLVFPGSLAARTAAAAWSKLVSTGSRFSLRRVAVHALVAVLAVSPAGIVHDVDDGWVRSGGPPHWLMSVTAWAQGRVPVYASSNWSVAGDLPRFSET